MPPSTLSLLGIVRHAAEFEAFWFRRVFLDETFRPATRPGRTGTRAFAGASPDNAADGLAAFDDACGRSRQIVADAGSFDDVGRRRLGGQEVSLRWIVVHLIGEYARHNGHADLLRQAIDGVVG